MTLFTDPLEADHPPLGAPLVESYWAASAGDEPENDGPLGSDKDCDIAIIGGGYTGLSAAWYLAKAGIKPVVLEAARPAWGCSSRNGGACKAVYGRLPLALLEKRHGLDGARALFREQARALESVRDVIAAGEIDCDKSSEGWLKVAHRPTQVAGLLDLRDRIARFEGPSGKVVDATTLAQDFFQGEEAYGAYWGADGFGLHPLKLAWGLLSLTRSAGAVVHSASPVLSMDKAAGYHLLQTPGGTLRAKTVILATNGYAGDCLNKALRHRTLPVLSICGVTRPLTPEELAATNFICDQPLADTRHTLFYYRRLPDNRLLMGGRGPIREEASGLAFWRERLQQMIRQKYPALGAITLEYFWSGWVCLTLDRMAHVHQASDDSSLLYALGYNGTGIAPGIHAGRLLSEKILRGAEPAEPLACPLPKIPFAAFRRPAQKAAFLWHRFLD